MSLFAMFKAQPGQALLQRGVYLFICPTCGKTFRYDDPYGPMCTGTSETRDEHDPIAMRLLKKDERQVTV